MPAHISYENKLQLRPKKVSDVYERVTTMLLEVATVATPVYARYDDKQLDVEEVASAATEITSRQRGELELRYEFYWLGFPQEKQLLTQATVMLRPGNSWIEMAARFPLERPSAELSDLALAIGEAFGVTLHHSTFRLCIPKKKRGGYNLRKIEAEWPRPTRRPKQTYRHDRDSASLLAEVYANPKDLELRLVCADVLQERGDPRGELIVLQIAEENEGHRRSARTKRIKEIITEHRVHLMGGLASYVGNQGLRFRRGFLSACEIDINGRETQPVPIEVATLEELHFRKSICGEWALPFIGHPTFDHLGRLTGITADVVIAFAQAGRPRALVELAFGSHTGATVAGALELLGASETVFPSLRRLGVFVPGYTWDKKTLARLFSSPVGGRLEELRVHTYDFSTWIQRIQKRPSNLTSFHMVLGGGHLDRDHKGWRATLRRDDVGALTVLEIRYHAERWGPDFRWLSRELQALPEAALTELRFVPTRALHAIDEVMSEMSEAAAHCASGGLVVAK